MKRTISFGDFCDAFHRMGRGDQFTYEGKRALFDYLEEYEESTGTTIELDVIALCCEYGEGPIKAVLEDYNLDTIDDLQAHTSVVFVDDDTVVYQAY